MVMNLDLYDRGCVHNKSHAATKAVFPHSFSMRLPEVQLRCSPMQLSTTLSQICPLTETEPGSTFWSTSRCGCQSHVSTQRITRLKVTQWVLLIMSNCSPLHNCCTTLPAFDKVPDSVQIQPLSLGCCLPCFQQRPLFRQKFTVKLNYFQNRKLALRHFKPEWTCGMHCGFKRLRK